jgi:tetratricopeptide (TPR) repeat protein
MIAARLDRLPTLERHVALRAAVVGSSFWPGAVKALNGVGDVETSLEALAGLDVAEERAMSALPGEREFAFKHQLIRDVAYERLPKGLRAELHVRSAGWFAGQQQHDEHVETTAYHLEQACRLAGEIERSPIAPPVLEAAEALRTAAEKAERREGFEEADRFYVRALDLVVDEEHPVLAVELRLARARILAALGRLSDAAERFQAVASDAAAIGRDDLRGAALVGLGNALQKQGRPDAALAELLEARQIAVSSGEVGQEVQALFELAEVHRDFTGEVELARAELERALELGARLEDRHLLADGYLRVGFLHVAAGRLEPAEQALAESAEISSALGSRRGESRAMFLRAWVAFQRGRAEEAERLALDAHEWFERTGDSYFLIQSLQSLALFARARGGIADAERRLREALELARPSGGFLVSSLLADLAEVVAEAGRLDEARAAAQEALAEAPRDDAATRAAALIAAVFVAGLSGDRDAIRARGEEALFAYRHVGDPLQVIRSRIVLAAALGGVGDHAEALDHLEVALGDAEKLGALALLRRARALRESLSRPD